MNADSHRRYVRVAFITMYRGDRYAHEAHEVHVELMTVTRETLSSSSHSSNHRQPLPFAALRYRAVDPYQDDTADIVVC